MTGPRLFRVRGAYALAVVVVAASATFCMGGGSAASSGSGRSESLSAASSPAPVALVVGQSKPAISFVTAIRATKERRVTTDALLLGAAMLAALCISRQRVNRRLRDQLSISAFFARRRGPPSLSLAR